MFFYRLWFSLILLAIAAMVVPSCPGGIGLLTVVMVSGSVVVLLVLAGSHKLLEPAKSGSSSGSKRSCLIISSGNKCDRKKKRVRFAADVVEPQGNNEIYRRVRGHTDLVPAIPTDKSSMKPDAEDGRDLLRESCVGRRTAEDRRIQSVAMPNIPANRRVLYNGMLQYSRMQRASVY